jgi:hypothetical protein
MTVKFKYVGYRENHRTKRKDEGIRCLKCRVWLHENCWLYTKNALTPEGSLQERMSQNKRSFLNVHFQL